ncbi:TIM barrel protein [Georgenia sp. MJ173]|uniref:TIM barrel protein n=1 Tax=Georgenia sunbinii TaxID=3117728 RepID=UPI002F2620F7
MSRTSSRALRRGAALLAAAALPATMALSAPAMAATPADPDAYWPIPEDQIGLVLFTTRTQMAEDPQGTLNALAQCGFTNAEPSGGAGNFYGLTGAELAPMAEEAGINVRSIGVSLGNLTDDLDLVIAEAEALGAKYVRLSGSGSWDTLADYAEAAATLDPIAEALAAEGITLAYHNHGWEFEVEEDGVTGYETLLNETEHLAMELDVYWAASVGVSAADMFEAYPGRFPLVHVKDMAEDGSFADVGEGVIDFQEMFALRDVAGIEWYFIEHDRPTPDGVTSACNSLANLTADPSADSEGIPLHATVPELGDGEGGALTLSVADFGASVDLGRALNAGDRWRFSGELPTVSVTDSRAAQGTADGWSVTGQTTDFGHTSGELSGSHLGWVPGQLEGKVGVTPGAAVAGELSGGPGLAVPATLASAVGEGRLGSTELGADLVLETPVDVADGVYTSTVTLSLFPVD